MIEEGCTSGGLLVAVDLAAAGETGGKRPSFARYGFAASAPAGGTLRPVRDPGRDRTAWSAAV
ncbi:hypothetical protein [Streptomyces spiralis]